MGHIHGAVDVLPASSLSAQILDRWKIFFIVNVSILWSELELSGVPTVHSLPGTDGKEIF